METYAKLMNYAVPFFVVLIGIEAFFAWRKGAQINRGADVISSLSSGITNVIKDVLGVGVVIVSYDWLLRYFQVVEIKATWAVYLIGFIVIDFAGYWMHRLSHEINFLWNRHIIHHSSEEFNLACALRQSISTIFSFIAIFMIPAALVGVPSQVIAVIAPLHLFAQFWYHTRLIDRMGWLETWLVTPSHHRVHHAMNAEYLDKNYGQIFIFWDKWFGTFQEELPEVEPVYGVKRPVRTWNPIIINFQHLWLLFKDAWRTRSWWDKVRLWFMPTGWRPSDVAQRFPVGGVSDVHSFEKYDTHASKALLVWSWIQLVFTLTLMFYLFNNIVAIGLTNALIYGGFLFLCIYSFTTLLDKSPGAVYWEALKTLVAFALIYWQGGDWFGMAASAPIAFYLLIAYLLASVGIVYYFVVNECVGNELDVERVG